MFNLTYRLLVKLKIRTNKLKEARYYANQISTIFDNEDSLGVSYRIGSWILISGKSSGITKEILEINFLSSKIDDNKNSFFLGQISKIAGDELKVSE